MEDLIRQIAACSRQGERGALSSLVASSGSIPMSERAKMLVKEDGQILGTIGGGCLEAEIVGVGQDVLKTGIPQISRFTLTEEQAGESGLNCGGSVSIYTELVGGGEDASSDDVFTAIAEAKEARQACVLATLLSPLTHPPRRTLYLADGQRIGSLGTSTLDDEAGSLAAGVMASETAVLASMNAAPVTAAHELKSGGSGEGRELFLEPFVPPPVLYVFGGGHVGGQICRLARGVGFRVVVIDDRPMFASAQRHPDAHECIVGDPVAVFDRLDLDERAFVVAATRGHQHDEVVVEKAIRTRAGYIGMLGSERKKVTLWKRLTARGGDPERLAQVYAPIGLNIGADNPEEIAVSVVAELIEVRRAPSKVWKTKRSASEAPIS
jgi:xanthine dehydrogenase accessory factor